MSASTQPTLYSNIIGNTPSTISQPPDTETRNMSKQYFKLIQGLHHKHIINHAISSGTFPPGMVRQVNRLTDFIKPAGPTESTRKKVQDNTTQWMLNNMHILQQHYEDIILTLNSLPFNDTALQIATGWARKRYGTRLRSETLQTIEHIIYRHQYINTSTTTTTTSKTTPIPTKPPPPSKTRQRLGNSLSPIPELSNEDEFPPLPAPHRSTVLSLGPRTTLAEHIRNYNGQHQTKSPPPPVPIQPPTPSPTPFTTQTYTHPIYSTDKPQKAPRPQTRTGPIIPRLQPSSLPQLSILAQGSLSNLHPTSSTYKESKETPPGPQTSTPQTPRTKTIKTDQPDLSPIPPTRTRTTKTRSPLLPTPPLFRTPQKPKITTQAQVHQPPGQQDNTSDLQSISLTTHSNSNVSIIITDTISPFCSTPAGGADSGAGMTLQQARLHHKEEGNIMMKGPIKAKTESMKPHSEPLPHYNSEGSAPGRAGPDSSPPAGTQHNTSELPLDSPPRQRTLTPTLPGKFKPTYHLSRPSRKLQDWTFRGRKPVLVLGDSNINRIPPHHNPQIQLDSYPGANLYHFLKICEKTAPHPTTKIVIFSIGINNRDQDAKLTSCKQLRALYKQATVTFPNADIYFPIMNYSPHLTPTQQNNLKIINNTIATYLPFLTEIPHDTFTTEHDNIHWKADTAKNIFENWCQQLNL